MQQNVDALSESGVTTAYRAKSVSLCDNTAALTVAFLMAVSMSMVLSPPRGSTDSSVLPKVSWNM